MRRQNGVSLKYQIAESLKSDIQSLDHSEKIPSEQKLMEKYQVSRGTIRQAIAELVKQGLVYRIQGKGTFKCVTTFYNSGGEITSLTDQLVSQGLKPGIEQINICMEEPNDDICSILMINRDVPVWKISRIRLADNYIISYNIAYIRSSLIPHIAYSDFKMSLIEMITDRFGKRLIKSEHYCYAIAADEFLADKLSLEIGSPVLEIKFIAYGIQDEKPIFVDNVFAIGDRQYLRFEQANFMMRN